MTRIEREKRVISRMMAIYCRSRHGRRRDALCDECAALLAYSHRRLDHCRHGERKPTCRKCTTHCYAPAMRTQMREVMRYVGPRMIFHHPLAAIRHLLSI